MDNINNTPISRKNKHLNEFERGQIAALYNEGFSAYAIGKRLKRASNTIRNELKRGTVIQIKKDKEVEVYYPDTGQMIYENNRKNCGKKYRFLECEDFLNHVIDQFKNKKISLDAIVGRSLKTKMFKKSEMVCTKTLYNYVDLGLLDIKNIDLPLKLRRSTKPKRIRKNKRILGRSISDRPENINSRKEFGHWEIDTMIGKKSKKDSVLLTLTERQTRMEIIEKIDSKTSDAVLEALDKVMLSFGHVSSEVFKSLTSDNGSEFSNLGYLENKSSIKIYYAHPYSSFERGTNERHNGLIRRFIPKGKSLNNYSTNAIARVETWCNTLPRKILDYLTPQEVFMKEIELLKCY